MSGMLRSSTISATGPIASCSIASRPLAASENPPGQTSRSDAITMRRIVGESSTIRVRSISRTPIIGRKADRQERSRARICTLTTAEVALGRGAAVRWRTSSSGRTGFRSTRSKSFAARACASPTKSRPLTRINTTWLVAGARRSASAKREAVTARQHVIGDHRVGNFASDLRERRVAGGCEGHLEAAAFETPAVHFARVGIVVHDQDGRDPRHWVYRIIAVLACPVEPDSMKLFP